MVGSKDVKEEDFHPTINLTCHPALTPLSIQ